MRQTGEAEGVEGIGQRNHFGECCPESVDMASRSENPGTEKTGNKSSRDDEIVRMLSKNSRTSFMKIAEQIGVSEGAVRSRVRNLLKRGVIKRFTLELGHKANALILVSVRTGVSSEKIAARIKHMGASCVFEVAGKSDIMCLVDAPSLDETNSFIDRIRSIEGVISTETMPILKEAT
ncbi:transcriptional regulator [Candidatus Woesearchaeota archaeon CG10_big_fil_rev_8_21_14_0_10_44_13]|nr:MAG: transcriptional regulator [Candidatus Woesearchaeota archaeon CG10_big_fil_rev_8_21_14_0_10_44_13]